MRISLILAVFAALLTTGCATSTGAMPFSGTTSVELSGGNYKVIKAGAVGTSRGFNVLGIPLKRPKVATAKSGLYRHVPGGVEGKAVALNNLTMDKAKVSFVLFSFTSLTLGADVIEFNGDPPPMSN